MPENDHAREYDKSDNDYADGKALPAFLNVAFVLRNVKFFIIKLIHLGGIISHTPTYFSVLKFAHFSRRKNDILRALLKGLN